MVTFLKINLTRLILLVVFLLTIGCGGTSSLVRNYYLLDYPIVVKNEIKPQKPFPIKVGIKRFTIPSIYERDNKVVFRSSQFQLRYYAREVYVAKPNILITDLVAKHIKQYGIFEQFGKEFIDSPDYEIIGSVDAIERYDIGEFGGAHFAMTLKLVHSNDYNVVVEHKFNIIEKLYNPQTSALVKEFSQILDSQTDNFIEKINEFFKDKKFQKEKVENVN